MRILMLHDGTETCNMILANINAITDCNIHVASLKVDRPKGFLLESGNGMKEYLGDPAQIENDPHLQEAEIVVVHLSPFSGEAIRRCPNLKLIASARSSAVNVDVQAASERHIPVVSCPGRNARAVAEFTIGLVFALCRQIPKADRVVREGLWTPALKRSALAGPELEGKTFGVVGYGSIGRMVSSLATALGMKVVFHDPAISDGEADGQVDLEDLLRMADFVSLHARAPEGPSPKPIIGQRELSMMKPTAYLINTARGCLIDETALEQILRNGTIAGAALDTFVEEPLPASSALLDLPNVLLAPHIGGNSTDQARHAASMLVGRVHAYLRGETLPSHVIENYEEV